MQVRFSSEIRVANAVYQHLTKINATVIQFVSPGGQARISLTYSKSIGRRTIYPDVLAIFEGAIWVGEIKPRFSNADKEKLLELQMSQDGEAVVRSTVSRNLRLTCDEIPVRYCLFHGDVNASADPAIAQLCFCADGSLHVK
jgi:hypothetical protein